MNLKVPGVILPLGCAILSTKARAVDSLTIPGGQDFHFPHLFLKFRSNFLIFPQTLLIFFLVLRVGESPTREGPGYATDQGENRLGVVVTPLRRTRLKGLEL